MDQLAKQKTRIKNVLENWSSYKKELDSNELPNDIKKALLKADGIGFDMFDLSQSVINLNQGVLDSTKKKYALAIENDNSCKKIYSEF